MAPGHPDRSNTCRRVVLACIALSCMVASASSAAPIMPPTPDAGWLFDDASGSQASALHGGVDATLFGDASFSTDTPFGYAGDTSLLLDGSGDYAEAAAHAGLLNGATGYAISAWIRSDATSQDRAFFSGADPGTSDTFGARYDAAGWLPGNSGTTNLIKLSLQIGGAKLSVRVLGRTTEHGLAARPLHVGERRRRASLHRRRARRRVCDDLGLRHGRRLAHRPDTLVDRQRAEERLARWHRRSHGVASVAHDRSCRVALDELDVGRSAADPRAGDGAARRRRPLADRREAARAACRLRSPSRAV